MRVAKLWNFPHRWYFFRRVCVGERKENDFIYPFYAWVKLELPCLTTSFVPHFFDIFIIFHERMLSSSIYGTEQIFFGLLILSSNFYTYWFSKLGICRDRRINIQYFTSETDLTMLTPFSLSSFCISSDNLSLLGNPPRHFQVFEIQHLSFFCHPSKENTLRKKLSLT